MLLFPCILPLPRSVCSSGRTRTNTCISTPAFETGAATITPQSHNFDGVAVLAQPHQFRCKHTKNKSKNKIIRQEYQKIHQN